MPETRNMAWFRRAALAATLLCAIVVVVGAWVRLTNAGLGCPDWPGCYGHAHPAQAVERAAEINAANPGPALRLPESHQRDGAPLHRRRARPARDRPRGALGRGTAAIPAQPRVLPWVLVVLLVAAGAARHVDGDAAPEAAHRHAAPARRPPDARAAVVARAAAGASRAESGGAAGCVASRSRASRCSRCRSRSAAGPARTTPPPPARIFPTCQASYWPPMDFRNAFILWRGLGIDYEGGVLDAPARVAIHYTHRLGAYVTAFVLLLVVVGAWRRGQSRATRVAGDRGRRRRRPSDLDRDEPHLERLAAIARHGPQRRRGAARARDGRAAPLPEPALRGRPLPAVAALARSEVLDQDRQAGDHQRQADRETRTIEEKHGRAPVECRERRYAGLLFR